MNLNTRISEIIEYSKLTSSEFADEIDVQRSSISHITSGRNKPSLDFLIKVKERFSELSWDWLITGEGTMITPVKQETPTSLPDLFNIINDEKFGIDQNEDEKEKIDNSREFAKPFPLPEKNNLSDSQRLENLVKDEENAPYFVRKKEQTIAEAVAKSNGKNIKRILLFFDDGTFENYEA